MDLNWMSMDNEIFWGILLIIFSLMMGSLAWVVFSSLISNNNKFKYIYLVLLLLAAGINLNSVFNYSFIIGWVVGFIYFMIPITDFLFRQKRKRKSH